MSKSTAILNWNENLVFDNDAVEEYEFFEFHPLTGTQINSHGEIIIRCESQDIFTHPSESYLLISGRLTKQDGTSYADEDAVALTNNGVMHLFDSFRFSVDGKVIETVRYPGQATTMLRALTIDGDQESLNKMWAKDTSADASLTTNAGFAARQKWIVQSPNQKGSFQVAIPLKEIFGFCRDYTKVLYGLRQVIKLVRGFDDDAIFKAPNVDPGKVILHQITWHLPIVTPKPEVRLKLYEGITEKIEIPITFKNRHHDCCYLQANSTAFEHRVIQTNCTQKPRYVIVAFQTGKENDQERNSSIFDHCDVETISVYLNHIKYPRTDYDLDINNNCFGRVLHDITKYSDFSSEPAHCDIRSSEWKNFHPLYVFDVSKQSERLRTGEIDVCIRGRFRTNLPKDTRIFVLLFCDQYLTVKSNGYCFKWD